MANETGETEVQEYKVREDNLPWLDKKFEKMAKVAVEVGSKPPVYKIVREEYIEDKEFDEALGQWVSRGFHKNFIITVEGEPPKLAGWTFVASLTHTKDGNLINKVPGVGANIPEKYRTGAPWCDYCETSRRRVDSFIVRNESGEYKQIGRNCLAKFLGYSNPERVAMFAQWLAELQQEIVDRDAEIDRSGRSRGEYRDLVGFLTMVSAVVDRDGWRSVTSARETGRPATISEVERQLDPHTKWHQAPRFESPVEPTAEQRERAMAAIAFARSDKLTTDTDFKHNLKMSTASDMFHEKASGIVASLINYREHDKEWELRRAQWKAESDERKAKEQASNYVGEVGQRITVPVQVVRRKQLESQFGITYMFRMLDGDGDVIVWFASNDALEEGKWYNLIGTIKKLETYEGVKQTIVTRCKAEAVEQEIVTEDVDIWGKQVATQRAQSPKVRKSRVRRSEPMTTMGSVSR